MSYVISEEQLNNLNIVHAQIKLILQLANGVSQKTIELDVESLTGTMFHLEEQLKQAISNLPILPQ